MTQSQSEPRNPFYLLLIAVSLAFVVTALAYAFVPILEEKARAAGQPPPPMPSAIRCAKTAGSGCSTKARPLSYSLS
jgi:hypothetical protein